MFTTENLQSVGFSSPGMLTRTLKSLVEKDIIRKNDAYKLQDPIFKKWLMLLSSKFRAV
jgi:DNA-binding HxlR family transcriptional regulator